jgi:bacterial/archaeal transporter family-2 protein
LRAVLLGALGRKAGGDAAFDVFGGERSGTVHRFPWALVPECKRAFDSIWRSMSRWLAIVATFVAGALVALQPPANAELGKRVGTLGAAFVSLSVSLILVAIALAIAGGFGGLREIGQAKPEHLLGGLAGAAIVTITIVSVRELGAGGVVAVTVCTQLAISAVLDRLGVLGLTETPFDWTRVLGIAFLIAGTVLMTLRYESG